MEFTPQQNPHRSSHFDLLRWQQKQSWSLQLKRHPSDAVELRCCLHRSAGLPNKPRSHLQESPPESTRVVQRLIQLKSRELFVGQQWSSESIIQDHSSNYRNHKTYIGPPCLQIPQENTKVQMHWALIELVAPSPIGVAPSCNLRHLEGLPNKPLSHPWG